MPQEGFRKYLSIPVAGQEGVRLARVAAAGHVRHQSHRKKGKNQKKCARKPGMKVTAINLDPDLILRKIGLYRVL